MRVLSGELSPTNGDVRLHGTALARIETGELATRRSVMAQSMDVVFDFTVEEILGMGWVRGSRQALAWN